MYSVKDLMYIHERIGIPIVFDYHHHKFCTLVLLNKRSLDGNIYMGKRYQTNCSYSESKLHEGNEKLKPQTHSDYINELPNLYGNDVDVMGFMGQRIIDTSIY